MAEGPKGGERVRLSCSFCGKRQGQVAKIIAGPSSYICDECVDLCNQIITEERDEGVGAAAEPPPPSRPVARRRLKAVEMRVSATRDALDDLMAELRQIVDSPEEPDHPDEPDQPDGGGS